MNTEKEITFTDLRGKFTKDFDSFGKMDPFLEFVIGKTIARTETASGAGKEPQWKNSIVLTYFDETAITLRAYDEDATENEFIGTGKLEIKGLRFPGGSIDVAILTDSGENIGTISGKYTIKNLNPTPLLLLKNIRCSFVKEHSFLTKTKPYLQAASEEASVTTDPKEEAQGLSLAWTEGLRLRVKEGSKITLSLLDKNDNGAAIFRYECSAKEFRLQAGSKRFNVFGNDFLYLGTIEFDFETVNLVSKEESVKNAERQKRSQGELTSISLEKVRTELVSAGRDLYYHFVIGTNMIATEVTKNTPANSSIDLKRTLYADSRENKLSVLIWEKNMLRDKVMASGSLPLEGLSSGDRKVTLVDADGKDAGSVWLSLVVKQVPAKVLLLDNITVELTVPADLIGESEPYLVARLGGASARTQTGDKNNYTFKRGIQLKSGEEDLLELQLWEEDVTNDEKVYSEKVKLGELKGLKGDLSFKLAKIGQTAPTARLTFKYELKINAPPEPSKKQSEKKSPEEPKPAPKVESVPQKVEAPRTVVPQKKNEPESKKEQDAVEELKKKGSDVKPRLEEASKTIQQPAQPPQTDPNRKRRTEESLQNSQLKRSLHKDSILPSINTSHQNYGDRIFEKQSAATLQKSIVAYSMPKANRFTNEPKYTGEPSYCIDSCFKSSSMKGVGFGFGRKKQFPDWVERNMKENPAPGTYFQANADLRSRGPTFGIAHKFYEKVMIPKEKLVPKTTHRKLSPIHK